MVDRRGEGGRKGEGIKGRGGREVWMGIGGGGEGGMVDKRTGREEW